MKVFLLAIFVLTSLNVLADNENHLQNKADPRDVLFDCENKDFHILVKGSELPYIYSGNDNDAEFLKKVFKNDVTVTVKNKNGKSYTYSLVAATSDGAGQSTFQAFERGNSLSPLKMRTDFYYEHEGWCLDGEVYSHKQKKWIGWDNCWGDGDNRMMCDFDEL